VRILTSGPVLKPISHLHTCTGVYADLHRLPTARKLSIIRTII